ncbi:MAG: hypothetical protein HYU27_10090 [Acidobacteria bacterium]|nr:hypothetical protein [Acidobacteriota bacterium]
MNQRIARIVYAIASLGLVAASWIFAVNLLPSLAAAEERGIFVPLLVTWTMIAITTLSGIALAAFLTLRKGSE